MINTRKIGIILAIIFVVGLTGAIIYSRGYVERQKTFVQIIMTESGELNWSYETTTTVRAATEVERERQDVDWVVDIVIPYEAYSETMGEIVTTTANITTDGSALLPQTMINLMRENRDNGDIRMILGLPLYVRSWDGEGAVVVVSYIGLNSIGNLVPPEVIHRDEITGGHYVYTISRYDGAWGPEYTAQRINVTIGMPSRVGIYTFILMPDLGNELIVSSSASPLTDGQPVRFFD